jgi:hypothetical protein
MPIRTVRFMYTNIYNKLSSNIGWRNSSYTGDLSFGNSQFSQLTVENPLNSRDQVIYSIDNKLDLLRNG